MTTKAITKHIQIRKKLLNFLLFFLSPTNKFIVFLSQNLDILVAKRQRVLYNRHKNKHLTLKSNKKIDTYIKIA